MNSKNSSKIPITIARGNGIGPEIMQATLKILEAASAPLEIHEIEVGETVYLKGHKTGIEPKSWDIIQSTKCFLKAPVTTPEGGGFRSLNVTLRTALGLYANVRPSIAYDPFIKTKHPGMNVVIVRENEEDLYTGIEYRHSEDSFHALKVITTEGSEKIIRYAFEYARRNGRKKVTCFTKDNILKLTDGLFHKIYEEIGKEYPEIEKEHWIVDIGAAKLADNPTQFDVIVLPNLYGDILSDVSAQIAGSVGLAASANIGDKGAMFEAIHGSAPRRAGKNLANPSGLILASVLMLEHLGKHDTADLIENSWLKTIEDGIHTYDIFVEGKSKKNVGTKEFADAVIARLGKKPEVLKPSSRSMTSSEEKKEGYSFPPSGLKELIGVDIYIDSKHPPKKFQEEVLKATKSEDNFILTLITNRGLTIFPHSHELRATSSHYRTRFMPKNFKTSPDEILRLVRSLLVSGFDITMQINLYSFGGKPGFSAEAAD